MLCHYPGDSELPPQSDPVELADRKALETTGCGSILAAAAMRTKGRRWYFLSGGGDAPATGGGFHMPFFGGSLNVGAMVEPLTSQMAESLGVPSGAKMGIENKSSNLFM